jgi:hypothetical protein
MPSQLDTDTLRLIPEGAAAADKRQQVKDVFRREKAMAASLPGTEYWLP